MKTITALSASLAYLNLCNGKQTPANLPLVAKSSARCTSSTDNIHVANPLVVPNPQHATFEQEAAVPVAAALEVAEKLGGRALPNSPSGGYTPATVDCPSTRPTIRKAGSLSTNETEWLPIRRNNTVQPMIDLLTRINITGFDAQTYLTQHANNATALPNIAIAASGGGYRALLNGAGFVAAADNRTTNSTSSSSQIGGLLQATTYLAGLSGGNWLTGSLFMNNFSSVEQLRDGSSGSDVWQFSRSIFEGPESSGLSILNTAEYFKDLYDAVQDKQDAGFNTSITDYWGRALSYQLINATDGGPAYTFSSIAQTANFQAGLTPFPISVADGRAPNTLIISLNSTVFEFNPFEMGSWDPSLYAFAPLEYTGSYFSAGEVPETSSCVRGFDNGGFVMGTSSSLFNQAFLMLNSSSSDSFLTNVLTDILADIGSDNDDIAEWNPNPFYLFNNGTAISQSQALNLVDGGEDGQNIPLDPLIQPQRGVDVIFAIDSSADTDYNWPNGTSLVATYERATQNATAQNGTGFPSIPGQNTFVNLGLNKRPTFFGCNESNITNGSPLIVYMPNAPYSFYSNVSTFNLSYTDAQRDGIIQNGFDVATRGNNSLDSDWTTCLGCAILSRSFTKTGTTVPSACQTCFTNYCWNGTLAPNAPSEYSPTTFLVNATATSAAVIGFETSTRYLGFAIAATASLMLL